MCHNLPSAYPRERLEQNELVDAAIYGEEDVTMRELCESIFRSKPLAECKGIEFFMTCVRSRFKKIRWRY